MKILIVNQHTQNHGDEAAGLALIRNLYNNGYKELTVSYSVYDTSSPIAERCYHKYQDVRHIVIAEQSRLLRGLSWRLLLLYLKFPCFLTHFPIRLLSKYRGEYRAIQGADFIVNAPGGVNLGLYRDNNYVWRLYQAYSLKKKYAIYSPSIGPFPESSNWFSKRAKEILKGADFLSLRDAKSYGYADDLKLNYIKSIDTAYLESSEAEIPKELKPQLASHYVVIVPNQLYVWHQKFKDIDPDTVDGFYRKIIDLFLKKECQVVLLPQLYGRKDNNDEPYFKRLRGENEGIVVVSSEYSSDIQQRIIEKASFVVGARYHTIVFAVNNATPFFCLSYEHKMMNMLEILKLEKFGIDISLAFNNQETTLGKILSLYDHADETKNLLSDAKKTAKKIARDTFELFVAQLDLSSK